MGIWQRLFGGKGDSGSPAARSSRGGSAAGGDKYHAYHWWTPRFWTGMFVGTWLRLLARNHFHIGPSRVAMTILITLFGVLNVILWGIQELIFGRRFKRLRIVDDPVFILGHWRSGTTMLHEMLILDPRNTYPTTYDCFAPNHFFLTAPVVTRFFRFVLPSRRPMDNMPLGWDRPQEDEFALCNLGVPSPYLTMAFPNRPPQYPEYLDMAGLTPRELEFWKQRFRWFLSWLTMLRPRRIILKSPPHTSRVQVLLEMFPGARFVHIVRDPYVIFPSTVRLWKSLYKYQGVHLPKYQGLDDHVFRTFERMYDAFEEQRSLIPPGQIIEIRYEELVRDPIGQMRAVYESLGLGEFDEIVARLKAYLDGVADYQTNKYQLSPELRDEVTRRWLPYMRKYGYDEAPAGAPATVQR